MRTIALLYDGVLNIGGVENHLLTILEKCEPARYRFKVISDTSKNFREKVVALGGEVIPFKRRHPLHPLTPFILTRIFKDEKIDLAHAHSPSAALWGRFTARSAGIPVIVTVHLPVDQYHGSGETIRARLGKKIYIALDHRLNCSSKYTRKLIYVSQEIYRQQSKEGSSSFTNAVVIPNGIDLNAYRDVSREKARAHFSLSDEMKVIIFVGRLDHQKGLDILIESIALLRDKGMDFRLWVVGEGGYRQEIENQVGKLGLSDVVSFWGYQEDLPLFLKASDIFVLPSRYEGMSIALLHAMAAGLPCVVTRVGDNPLLVIHGDNGLVVAPEKMNELVNALKMLLVDETLCRQMSQASELVASRYRDVRMVRDLEVVYNECCPL